MSTPLVLYDGYCALCDRSVQFLQKRQSPRALDYASLQSAQGQKVLASCGLSTREFDTLVFYEEGHCYLRSTAGLRILRYLRFPWPLLYGLLLIPAFLRDPVYNLIAHNRYCWFGRS